MPLRKQTQRAKYGPSDASRFCNIPADLPHITPDGKTNPRLGQGKIGKAEVQCRFLHEDSRWGRLKQKDGTGVCAGIIHMEILFKNLHECVLESATVRVVLDGEHHTLKSKNAVEVRQVGPQSIAGTPFGIVRRRGFAFKPTAEVGGMMSFSAAEAYREKEWTQFTRWVFEGGSWATGKSSTVNSAEWALLENPSEGQPSHGNCFRTAFLFVNDGQPFLLRVEVEGSLSKLRHKTKEKLKRVAYKFGSSPANPPPNTVIRGFASQTEFLDEYAARLDNDLNKLNGAIDFNHRPNGQHRDASPAYEADVDDKEHRHHVSWKEDAGEKRVDRPTEREVEAEYAEAFRIMAGSSNAHGHKGNANGSACDKDCDKDENEVGDIPNPHGTKVIQPQAKSMQQDESKILLRLFLEIWRELLVRIQQLLVLNDQK